jgi:hypothetical protein
MIPTGAPRGRKTIIVDEWGPYDWKSPKLWPVGRSDAAPQKLRVLGPAGSWKLAALEGVVSVSAEAGQVGDTLTVVPTAGRENDWRVELEYTGRRAFTTPFGEVIAANTPWRFGWERFVPRIDWRVRVVPWDSTRAIEQHNFDVAVATLDTNRLDLTWYRPPQSAIPQANILTQATGVVTLVAGRYRLRTISDDAVRVWLDNQLVLDDWNPGESHAMEVEITETVDVNLHLLRVVHLQKDGWYELRLDIERVR